MKVDESTVSAKGLTTIPMPIRTALKLKEGDKVEWYISSTNGQNVVIRKKE